MTAEAFAETFVNRARHAEYVTPGTDVQVPCLIRFEYAGTIGVDHGDQEKAVIKVLWEHFPQHPTGVFKVDGVEWKVQQALGKADGHLEGVQRALFCGANRRFTVDK